MLPSRLCAVPHLAHRQGRAKKGRSAWPANARDHMQLYLPSSDHTHVVPPSALASHTLGVSSSSASVGPSGSPSPDSIECREASTAGRDEFGKDGQRAHDTARQAQATTHFGYVHGDIHIYHCYGAPSPCCRGCRVVRGGGGGGGGVGGGAVWRRRQILVGRQRARPRSSPSATATDTWESVVVWEGVGTVCDGCSSVSRVFSKYGRGY